MPQTEKSPEGGCPELPALAIFHAKDRILLQKLKREREHELAKVRSQDLTLRGRQSRELEIYVTALEKEIRKRVRNYRKVSKERNCRDMLSPACLQQLGEDVVRHIEAGLLALRNKHTSERLAAGEWLPIDPRIYTLSKSPLQTILHNELGALRAEWQAALPTPETRQVNETAQGPQKTAQSKRGPKPDLEIASRVSKVVSRVAPNGDWRPKWEEICEALDEEQIPCPKPWRKDRTCRKWADKLEKSIVIKAIDGRLKLANQAK